MSTTFSSSYEIVPWHQSLIPAAAKLFCEEVDLLRQQIPALPNLLVDCPTVTAWLAEMAARTPGLIALHNGELVGYLGWWLVDNFRGTARRGAYCPEWAHGAASGRKQRIYQALYRAATSAWQDAGCQVHAITLLAHDQTAEKVWFWQGFGLAVVDAVRATAPLGVTYPAGMTIRSATVADLTQLEVLDAEHIAHYAQPPVSMAPRTGRAVAAWRQFLAQPPNSVWLALDGGQPVGFLSFAAGDAFDGADLLGTAGVIGINGAYVRPAYRGQGVAAALLDAALRAYAAQGVTSCTVNFESFNPEAVTFWGRYFTPVCLSLLRLPEWLPTPL